MPVTIQQQDIVQVNSTTYADLLGALVGLRRFTGETSEAFRDRVWTASHADRSANYFGLLNELNLQLGLKPTDAIRVWSTSGDVDVTLSLAGIRLTKGVETVLIPTVSTDGDDMWVWKSFSDLVAAINESGLCYAAVIGEDGYAFSLVHQSSRRTVLYEPIHGAMVKLAHAGLVEGSEVFSEPVSAYIVSDSKQVLTFDTPVQDGTTISYKYRTSPFTLVSSPVGLLSLVDPNLAKLAVTENNTLVYQMREYLQAIMSQDKSYWGL